MTDVGGDKAMAQAEVSFSHTAGSCGWPGPSDFMVWTGARYWGRHGVGGFVLKTTQPSGLPSLCCCYCSLAVCAQAEQKLACRAISHGQKQLWCWLCHLPIEMNFTCSGDRAHSTYNRIYVRPCSPKVQKVGAWGLRRPCALTTMFSLFWWPRLCRPRATRGRVPASLHRHPQHSNGNSHMALGDRRSEMITAGSALGCARGRHPRLGLAVRCGDLTL